MADNNYFFVGQNDKITCGFCACCAGPDMELMEGAFLSMHKCFFIVYSG